MWRKRQVGAMPFEKVLFLMRTYRRIAMIRDW